MSEHGGELPDRPVPAQPSETCEIMMATAGISADAWDAAEKRGAEGSLQRRADKTWRRTMASAVSAGEIAAELGISEDAVESMARKRELYRFEVDGVARYPTWQVTERRPSPGPSDLVRALPREWGPALVSGFATSPQCTLRIGDEYATPVEWMSPGRDVA